MSIYHKMCVKQGGVQWCILNGKMTVSHISIRFRQAWVFKDTAHSETPGDDPGK